MALRLSKQEYEALLAGKPVGKRAKYGNKKTAVGSDVFDSAFEARHYTQLLIRQTLHEIRKLERQIAFPVVVNGKTICTFTADFVYEERVSITTLWGNDFKWRRVVEDCKSPATRRERGYRLMKKLLAAVNQVQIREVLDGKRRRKR